MPDSDRDSGNEPEPSVSDQGTQGQEPAPSETPAPTEPAPGDPWGNIDYDQVREDRGGREER